MKEKIDTVIIGAGHAGLTMSHFLSQRGLEHLILERGRVAERGGSKFPAECYGDQKRL